MTRPFHDILGYDGVLREETNSTGWTMRTYWAVEDGKKFPIAESFGYELRDYTVDLGGSGTEELVTNVQYGGDGHQGVFVYQRRGDGIWRGVLDLFDLPDHDNWGANSTSAAFDPADGVFRVHYAVKGGREPGVAEYRGLDHVRFSKFRPME